jgi:hypothetical protein
MKNKSENKKDTKLPKNRKTREEKKIDLPKHGYPNPSQNDTQFKDQPEFIESNGSKKESGTGG